MKVEHMLPVPNENKELPKLELYVVGVAVGDEVIVDPPMPGPVVNEPPPKDGEVVELDDGGNPNVVVRPALSVPTPPGMTEGDVVAPLVLQPEPDEVRMVLPRLLVVL